MYLYTGGVTYGVHELQLLFMNTIDLISLILSVLCGVQEANVHSDLSDYRVFLSRCTCPCLFGLKV